MADGRWQSFISFEACQDDQLNLTEADGRHYKSDAEEIVSPEKPNEFFWIVCEDEDDVFEDDPSFYRAMSLSKELEWEKNIGKQFSKRKEESKKGSKAVASNPPRKSKRVLRIPSDEENEKDEEKHFSKRVGEEEEEVEMTTVETDGPCASSGGFAASPPKKMKKDSKVERFDLCKALFSAPISFQEDAEEDPEDQIPCGLCDTPLKVGMSAAGKEYMMCVNSETCRIQWVPFADTPAFHHLISETVLPVFKYPYPPTRCVEHMMPCKLMWARNTANRSLHNQMFWVCDARREDGAARKCGFILCATEENEDEAKKKSAAYFKEVQDKKESRCRSQEEGQVQLQQCRPRFASWWWSFHVSHFRRDTYETQACKKRRELASKSHATTLKKNTRSRPYVNL